MSETPARQQRNSSRLAAPSRDASSETLKALARKVLSPIVSSVSPQENKTPRHSPVEAETPGRQQRDTDLSDSMWRLEVGNISLAIFVTETDAGLEVNDHIVQEEAEGRKVWKAGGMVFAPREMLAYVSLSPAERKLFRDLKAIRESDRR